MFNSGYRGRRAPDNAGAINPQIKYTQVVYPVPTITGWSISGSDDTALNPAGGQTVLVNGTGFATGCAATLNGVTISPVTLVNPTQISFTSPANSGGSYTLIVYNSSGGAAILVPGLTYSTVPTWTTAAGSIGSYYETTAISTAVVATSDSAMTYTLASGSLPSGATLYANGVITGTAPVDSSSTTYTFGITATDAELQDTTRTFTLTINVDVVTWVTPSSGATITLDGSAYSQALSATDAAGYAVSYTANTLPTGLTLSAGTISGTPTAEGTTASLLTATAATTNRSSTNTVTWVVSLTDTYFKYVTTLLSANASVTTSSFVNDNSLNNALITVVGDTRAQNSNPYQPGYYSNYFSSSAALSAPSSSLYAPGTGDFTVECWVYLTSAPGGSAAIFGTYYAGSSDAYWGFGIDSSLRPFISGRYTSVVSSVAIGLNRWNHMAIARASGTWYVWVNGASGGTSTTSLNFNGASTMKIGVVGDFTAFTGYASNMRMINGYALYTSAFTPSTTPLLAVANTVFLTAQSNRFIDTSVINATLTISNTPQISLANPFTTVLQAGTQYYGASFDGSGDYLSVPSSPTLAFGTGDFTVECWAYWSATASTGKVIIDLQSSGTFNFYWDGGSYLTNYLVVSNRTANQLTYAFAPTIGTWYHLAVSRSGTSMKLFVNGVLATTVTDSTNYGSGIANIGGDSGVGSTWTWNGYISNLRIVKGLAVYTSKFVPSTTALTATTTVTAAQSWSTAFDGTGDYLSVASNSALGFGTGDFTVEFWVYLPSASTTQVFFDNRNAGTGIVIYSNSGTLTVNYNNSGGVLITGTTLSSNQWYHIALSRSSSSTKLFLNGTQSGSTASDSNNYPTNANYIGSSFTPSQYTTGYISNVRITKGQALYTANFTPATSPLTTTSQGATAANVSLLTCQNNLIQDNSTNYFAITVAGDARPASINPFVSTNGIGGTSYSGYFDGTGDYLTITSSSFAFGTGDFTIECFVNNTVDLNNKGIFQLASSAFPGQAGLAVGSGTGGFAVYYGATSVNLAVNTPLTLGSWYHIAYVRSGGVLTLYKNGVGAQVVASDTTNYTYNTLVIGGYYSTSYLFPGYISNFRITKGQALYTANFTPSTTPLATTSQGATAANVSLLTCQSTTFVDNSSNALAITVAGDTKTQTFNPFSGATSLLTLQNSTLIDNSAIASTITAVGNAQPVAQSPFTPVYYSNFFNGSTDYLTVPSNAAFTFGSGSFTIETWIYNTTTASQQTIVERRGSGFATGDWVLFCNESAGNFSFYAYDVNNASAILTATGGVANTWTHIAVVRNTNAWTMYINGVSAATTTSSATIADNSQVVSIGKDLTAGIRFYFSGYISNLRITKGQALYTTTFTPSTTPLTTTSQGATAANVSLLTCQSLYFIDTSTNVFAITTTGSPKIAGVAPFTQPTGYSASAVTTYGSGYFDGTGDWLTMSYNPALTLLAGDYTIECWVYFVAINTYNYLVMQDDGGNGSQNFQLRVNSSLQPEYIFWNTSARASAVTITSSTTLKTYQWNHIAVTYTLSNTTTRLFLNGVQVGSSTTATWNGSTYAGQTVIGNFTNGSVNQNNTYGVLNAYITDVRLIKGTALYTTAFQPNFTAPLSAVTNTQLLTLQTRGAHNDSDFPDQSGFNNIVTRNGNTTNGTFAPYGANYSNYFNGSSGFTGMAIQTAIGTNPLTIECWIYPTASTNYQNIIGCLPSITASNRVGLSFGDPSGTKIVWNWTTSSSTNASVLGPVVTLNTWSHVAISTLPNGTVFFGLNGTVTSSTGNTFTNCTGSQGSTWYMGVNQSIYDVSFNGYISNLRITNGTPLYISNYSVPTSPLTAVPGTVFLTAQSPRFVDRGPNNYALTVSSAPTVQKFSPFSTVVPTTYYSGYFNGSSRLVTSSSSVGISGTGNFTVECWFYLTVAQATMHLTDSATSGFLFFKMNAANICIGRSQVAEDTTITYSFAQNTWYHVAFTRSGTTVYGFVNGGLQVTATNTNSYTTGAFNIGQNSSGIQGFNGYISNLRYTSTAIYTSAFTPSTAPLTAVTGTVILTGQSNTFIDNSTNYYAITVAAGTPNVSTFAPPFNTTLYYSNYFDGTGDYLSTAVGLTSLDLTGGDFTLECWVYNSGAGAERYLFSQRGASSGWEFRINATNLCQFFYTGGSSLTSTGTITGSTWTHLAVTRSGTTVRIFINGALDSSATFSNGTSAAGSYGLYIGYGTTGGGYMLGYISNARIDKGQALYTAAFTPATSPLTTTSQGATAANVSLLTCQSPYFIDNSLNIYAITANGDTKVAATSPFAASTTVSTVSYSPTVFGGSMYFDGTGDYLYGQSITFGTNPFTIEFWYYPTVLPANAMLFSAAVAAGTGGPQVQTSTTSLNLGTYGVSNTISTSGGLVLNQWQHIAVSRIGTGSNQTTIYINGVAAVTGTVSTNYAVGTITIGGLYAGTGQMVTGYMSDIRVVNGAALYTANFFPGVSPATPTYTIGTTTYASNLLLSGTAGGVVDASRTVDFETVGDAKAVQFSPYSGSYYSVYYGGSAYQTYASNAVLGFGTGDFTIEGWWFFTGTISTYQRPWWFGDDNDNLELNTSVLRVGGASQGTLITGGTTIVAGTWYHIALTRASGTYKLWLNGSQQGSSATNSYNSTARTFTLNAVSNGSNPVTGYTSNIRIVKGQALYTASFTPSTSPLTTSSVGSTGAGAAGSITGSVSILSAQTNKFIDNSSNALTITNGGSPQVTTQNPFAVNTGTAYYFDGTGDYLNIGSASALNLSTGDFTIEAWVYQVTSNTYASIISSGNATWSSGACKVNIQTLTPCLSVNTNATTFSGPVITNNTWNHIAVARSGTSLKIFTNGVAGTTYTMSDAINLNYNSSTKIGGGDWDAASGYLTGYIADFRITKGYARYTSNFTPPTAPFKTN